MAPAVVSDFELPSREIPESAITPAPAAPSFNLFSLEKKTIAITGGGRGLGITLALAVVEAGGNAACLDILEAPAAEEWSYLTKVASSKGCGVSYHKCDVTNEKAMEEAIEDAPEEAEALDAPFWGAVACAGIQQQISAFDYPATEFNRILSVNVTGVFNTCKRSSYGAIGSKRLPHG